MNAVTRIGTAVNRFQIDVISAIFGRNRGIMTSPLTNLTRAIPPVMTKNTTASATAKAEVNLNESAK